LTTNIKGNKNVFFWIVFNVEGSTEPIKILPYGWCYWTGIEHHGMTIMKVFSFGYYRDKKDMLNDILNYWPNSKQITIKCIRHSKDPEQERILCSAIYIDDGIVYSDPRVLPSNKKSGMVVCGQRHHNCYGILYQFMQDKVNILKSEEGFLTSKGNFLTRSEAKELAFKIGQITKTSSTTLTSEDLW